MLTRLRAVWSSIFPLHTNREVEALREQLAISEVRRKGWEFLADVLRNEPR